MKDILEPGHYYYISNRANGMDNLFDREENYTFFLNQYAKYTAGMVDTYCYCLTPCEIQFLVRIKDKDALLDYFLGSVGRKGNYRTKRLSEICEPNFREPCDLDLNLQGLKDLEGLSHFREAEKYHLLTQLVSLQFGHFFNSYSKAFNKQQNRMGSLFRKTFKRLRLFDSQLLRQIVDIVHQTPVKQGLCDSPEAWSHTSLPILNSVQPTFLNRTEVTQWFENTDHFNVYHRRSA